MVASGPERAAVTAFFDADARNWDAIYDRDDVFSVIHQFRRELCLRWAAAAGERGRALEVGCGTGLTALGLAELGYQVTATDTAAAMLDRAAANAAVAGRRSDLALRRADVHALPFPDASFDLVVALGVVPWLEDATSGLREMARVLRPGGIVIVNCDNRARLAVWLDPRYTPALAAARRRLRSARGPASSPGTDAVRHSRREFEALLSRFGLEVERRRSFGFGPFTMLGAPALPRRAGVVINGLMQWAADRGLPPFAQTGAQYIVMARRS